MMARPAGSSTGVTVALLQLLQQASPPASLREASSSCATSRNLGDLQPCQLQAAAAHASQQSLGTSCSPCQHQCSSQLSVVQQQQWSALAATLDHCCAQGQPAWWARDSHSQQAAAAAAAAKQSWLQLWPAQRRVICSSAAAWGSADGPEASWPHAVPPLHEPHKHVGGSAAPAAARAPTMPAPTQPPLAGTAAPAAEVQQQESLFVRHRARFFMALLLMTTASTFLVFLAHIMIDATLSGLRSSLPLAQKGGLRYLNTVLNLRRAFGEALVQQLLETGIVDALVALVKPDADALVLAQACETIKRLVDSPPALEAMQKAGLLQAVDSSLAEGWVPRGALKPMQTLQRSLALATAE